MSLWSRLRREPETLGQAIARDLTWAMPVGLVLGTVMARFATDDIPWPAGLGIGALVGLGLGVRVTFRHTWPKLRASNELADIHRAATEGGTSAGLDTVVELDGRPVSAVVAEYDRGKLLLAGGVTALMVAFLLVMVILGPSQQQEDGSGSRWIAVVASVLLVPVTASILADGIRGRRLGVTSEGLLYGRPGAEVYVPWTVVSSVDTFARHQPMLGLTVSDASAVRGSRLSLWARKLQALRTGHDLALPLRPLDADDLAAVLNAAQRHSNVNIPSAPRET